MSCNCRPLWAEPKTHKLISTKSLKTPIYQQGAAACWRVSQASRVFQGSLSCMLCRESCEEKGRTQKNRPDERVEAFRNSCTSPSSPRAQATALLFSFLIKEASMQETAHTTRFRNISKRKIRPIAIMSEFQWGEDQVCLVRLSEAHWDGNEGQTLANVSTLWIFLHFVTLLPTFFNGPCWDFVWQINKD